MGFATVVMRGPDGHGPEGNLRGRNSAGGPTLHVVYRSCGSDNNKRRPGFYNKDLALASLLRAVEPVAHRMDLVFLNDGPIPPRRLAVMRGAGQVETLAGVGNRRSYRAALALPARRRWPPTDLVWFAEDDYLYRESALTALLSAAQRVPAADYFALYASVGHRPPSGGAQPGFAPVPARWVDSPPLTVDGLTWSWGLSHTATYGARVGALLEDRAIFAMSLYTATAWDHTACLAYQGYGLWQWRSLFAEMLPDTERTPRRQAKLMAAAPFRATVNVMSLRRRRHPHRLITADPPLCTHMEEGVLGVGTDWVAEAARVEQWARLAGLFTEGSPGG